MSFSLRELFSSRAGKALVVGGVLAASLYAISTSEQPTREGEFTTCLAFDAPLAVSDIDARGQEMDRIQKVIGNEADPKAKEGPSFSYRQLQIYNILDRFRLSLMDYQDWSKLVDKLGKNGVVIDRVCIAGYETLDIPVVLNVGENGRASLDINFMVLKSSPAGGGHDVVEVSSMSLDEISQKVELELVNRAVAYAALMGTAPMDRSLKVNDLALILTLWKAQSAAEQILQGIDVCQATGAQECLKTVRSDYPFLSNIIDDIAANMETMSSLGDVVTAEDRTLLRQMVAVGMLNSEGVREQVYLSLLAEIENMAAQGENPGKFFNHAMTDSERRIRTENLDRSFVDLPLEQIYDRWNGGPDDPAHDAIAHINSLREDAAVSKPEPSAVSPRPVP